MNLLQDIITYIRRIIKSPSNQVITDNLIIDYINRFWLMDVDARVQLFDLKTTYQFQTTPGINKYNMPLYDIQTEPGAQTIAWFPVYQGFMMPARINGVNVPINTQPSMFNNIWQNNIQQQIQVATGDGSAGPYQINLPFFPAIPGHVDMTGIIAYANDTGSYQDPIFVTDTQITNNDNFIQAIPTTSVFPGVYFTATADNGTNITISDSGEFLESGTGGDLFGLLLTPGNAPYGNLPLSNGYGGTFAISGATQANPCVLTCNGQFADGVIIQISGVQGMTELNGNSYTVLSSGPTTVTIDVDSSGFNAYISDGTAILIQNVVNYNTGVASNIFFSSEISNGTPIQAQCYYYQQGIPRSILWHNNTITMLPPPNTQYLVELECYLTPAAFLTSSNAIPFGYMAEYIARGAARKMLSDTGDVDQFNFYEPLFKEQEILVWKRSQRQWTSNRTETIYSVNHGLGNNNYNQSSGGY